MWHYVKEAGKFFWQCSMIVPNNMFVWEQQLFSLPTAILVVLWFFACSGQLIKTLADVKYGNHHLSLVQIIYNIVSFIVAIIAIVAFAICAKKKLNSLKRLSTEAEGDVTGKCSEGEISASGRSNEGEEGFASGKSNELEGKGSTCGKNNECESKGSGNGEGNQGTCSANGKIYADEGFDNGNNTCRV